MIVLINLISTWYMVGVIWLIQIVHYPLFRHVSGSQFPQFERDHSNSITPVVGIPMAIELGSAILLCFAVPPSIPRWLPVVGLSMVIGIWLSTALLQVPCHSKLAMGFDESTHQMLVTTNWIRTVLWTLRGGLMAYALWCLLENQSRIVE